MVTYGYDIVSIYRLDSLTLRGMFLFIDWIPWPWEAEKKRGMGCLHADSVWKERQSWWGNGHANEENRCRIWRNGKENWACVNCYTLTCCHSNQNFVMWLWFTLIYVDW